MQKAFIDDPDHHLNEKQILNEAGFDGVIRKADGGWFVFESVHDAEIWDNQI